MSIQDNQNLYTIKRSIVHSGYDRKTCWTHARSGFIPGENPVGVITSHSLDIKGCDVFYDVHHMLSYDNGETWSEFKPNKKSLGRREIRREISPGEQVVEGPWREGCKETYREMGPFEQAFCEPWPEYHSQSGKLLCTGQTAEYSNNTIKSIKDRSTAFSVYSQDTDSWSPFQCIKGINKDLFPNEGAGSTQRYDKADGTILLPTYAARYVPVGYLAFFSTVLHCSFDGENLAYIKHGSEIWIDDPEMHRGRSNYEPSLAFCNDLYYLTIRNEFKGYVTTSKDGLNYAPVKEWTWDDGTPLGNYDTQQHWLTHKNRLFLIYTRKNNKNSHVMLHRAPLYMAEVDTGKVCVIKETERILVPEHGARLGNFGVTKVSDTEYWVVVSEWMQTKYPNFDDSTICEKYGSDNRIFLVKILF